MKKVFLALLLVSVCVVPGLAQTVQQNINDDSKTATQVIELPSAALSHIILLTPSAPPSSLMALPPALLSEMALLPALPTGLLAKKGHPLKGQTTGNKRIDALIIASAKRNGLDPVLLYSVMHQESAFKLRAVSPKGARGLMQLIPATASRFGVRNIFNPQQNIEAGARYLRFLMETFKGDVSLALAAYNAGEGNVKKYGGQVPPFRETIKYVSQIRQRYETIHNSPNPKT